MTLRRSPSLLWASEKWGQRGPDNTPSRRLSAQGLAQAEEGGADPPSAVPNYCHGAAAGSEAAVGPPFPAASPSPAPGGLCSPTPSQLAREPELNVLRIQTCDAPRSPAGRQHAGRFPDGENDGPERGALAQGPAGAKCARPRRCERRRRSHGPGWDPGPLTSRCVSSGRSPTLSEPQWIRVLITEATALFPGNVFPIFQENMKAPDEKKQTKASGTVGAPRPPRRPRTRTGARARAALLRQGPRTALLFWGQGPSSAPDPGSPSPQVLGARIVIGLGVPSSNSRTETSAHPSQCLGGWWDCDVTTKPWLRHCQAKLLRLGTQRVTLQEQHVTSRPFLAVGPAESCLHCPSCPGFSLPKASSGPHTFRAKPETPPSCP
uniref:sterile alpha motif domain-containing protein 1 isoform X1 n=1 Tax=Callithrix jacchus TaxID=9483 RepID=UPI0023DCFBDB|nr:sterile alpha motif domain-containing protein 1 isoform X1 [Callithrix jacchus]